MAFRPEVTNSHSRKHCNCGYSQRVAELLWRCVRVFLHTYNPPKCQSVPQSSAIKIAELASSQNIRIQGTLENLRSPSPTGPWDPVNLDCLWPTNIFRHYQSEKEGERKEDTSKIEQFLDRWNDLNGIRLNLLDCLMFSFAPFAAHQGTDNHGDLVIFKQKWLK